MGQVLSAPNIAEEAWVELEREVGALLPALTRVLEREL